MGSQCYTLCLHTCPAIPLHEEMLAGMDLQQLFVRKYVLGIIYVHEDILAGKDLYIRPATYVHGEMLTGTHLRELLSYELTIFFSELINGVVKRDVWEYSFYNIFPSILLTLGTSRISSIELIWIQASSYGTNRFLGVFAAVS